MSVVDLLGQPVYDMGQVDKLLELTPGTARRWIDGYQRAGRNYEPIIRPEPTGKKLVTWGEFVEARLISEYRDAGVPIVNLHPAVAALRTEFGPYPLAHSRPFLQAEGRELVRQVQEQVDLDKELNLVVVRNGQLVLNLPAQGFIDSVKFNANGEAYLYRPDPQISQVEVDPLRASGEPVVRAVPTEIIAELVRAGDPPDQIAALYELGPAEVEAAIRFEQRYAA